MKYWTLLMAALLTGSMTGCSSPKDDMQEAEAEFTQEKTKTLQEYKECVDEADNEHELKKCEALLKAVEVMGDK